MDYQHFYVKQILFKSSPVDLSGEDMAMTILSKLVCLHMRIGILTFLCCNNAFQIFARGFVWRGHGHDMTLNVSVCAHL